MYSNSNLVLLTVVTVISATTYGDLNRDHNQRPVITKVNVTRTYMNTNGRRSIETYGRRAYVVNNQGLKKETNKWDNTLPNIVFPDQLEMINRIITEKNKLLNRFDNSKNATRDDNKKANATHVSNELKTTRIDLLDDVEVEHNSKMSKHNQSPMEKGHGRQPLVENITVSNNYDTHKQINVNNTRINDNRYNYTNNINVDKTKVNVSPTKSNENSKADDSIWSGGETTTEETGIGDRAAFTGDQCPKGKVKINDTCADTD